MAKVEDVMDLQIHVSEDLIKTELLQDCIQTDTNLDSNDNNEVIIPKDKVCLNDILTNDNTNEEVANAKDVVTGEDRGLRQSVASATIDDVEIEEWFSKQKRYKCSKCQVKPFDSKTSLLNHMRKHDKVITFQCSLCNQPFKTNKELVDHKVAHEDDNQSFVCELCKVAFSSHLEWLEHNLTHIHRSHYKCIECTKYFMLKSCYKIHLATHFNMNLNCEECGASFRSDILLKSHLNIHKRTHQCGECGKLFRGNKDLQRHMMTHTGVRPHQCLYCGKGFYTNQAKDTHTRVHTNDRPYACDLCGSSFKQTTDLKRHACKVVKREKKYECEICHKKFLLELSLSSHMLLHTDYRPYGCEQCEDKFVSLASLKFHIIYKHTTEMPFECKICNRKFKVTSGINRHMKTHELKKI